MPGAAGGNRAARRGPNGRANGRVEARFVQRINIIAMFAAGLAGAAAWIVLGPASSVTGPAPEAEAPERRPERAVTAARGAAEAVERIAAEDGSSNDAAPASGPGVADAAAEAGARDAAAFVDELEQMSPGYRNRVFLHAIRERGYYCEGIVDSQQGSEDFVVWRVACGEGRAFLVSPDDGELGIEALYYNDSVAPSPAPVEPGPSRGLPLQPR